MTEKVKQRNQVIIRPELFVNIFLHQVLFFWYFYLQIHCVCVCVCVCTCMLNHAQLFATPRTVAHQAPLSMRFFSGKNTRMGCRFLLQRIFLTQGSNLHLLGTLTLHKNCFPNWLFAYFHNSSHLCPLSNIVYLIHLWNKFIFLINWFLKEIFRVGKPVSCIINGTKP